MIPSTELILGPIRRYIAKSLSGLFVFYPPYILQLEMILGLVIFFFTFYYVASDVAADDVFSILVADEGIQCL